MCASYPHARVEDFEVYEFHLRHELSKGVPIILMRKEEEWMGNLRVPLASQKLVF